MKFRFDAERKVDGNTNDRRANRAEAAICEYVHSLRDASDIRDESTVSDMICDLRHFCDREGIDFEAALKSANMNWEAER